MSRKKKKCMMEKELKIHLRILNLIKIMTSRKKKLKMSNNLN